MSVNQDDIFNDHELIFAVWAEVDLFYAIGYKSNFDMQGAKYRAIKPIARARDTNEIVQILRNLMQP